MTEIMTHELRDVFKVENEQMMNNLNPFVILEMNYEMIFFSFLEIIHGIFVLHVNMGK